MVLGHVVVFEHAANEMQERGVVAHEELFIGADIAPNDRGDQFAVVLLSAESELSCDKIVKKQPAS